MPDLSLRLKTIASLVPDGARVCDVGTDHGYLAIELKSSGKASYVIAADVNLQPLKNAESNIKKAGVKGIELRLCDGLENIGENEVDTIVIAGMGGDSICGILDRAEWCFDEQYKLILQPMTKAEILRYWLSYNDFLITDEILIDDNGTTYQLICARYGKRDTLSDAELFLGKLELSRNNALFEKQLEKNIRRFEKLLKGLSASKDNQDKISCDFYYQIYRQLCSIKDSLKK